MASKMREIRYTLRRNSSSNLLIVPVNGKEHKFPCDPDRAKPVCIFGHLGRFTMLLLPFLDVSFFGERTLRELCRKMTAVVSLCYKAINRDTNKS
jgi:hypothetical protein